MQENSNLEALLNQMQKVYKPKKDKNMWFVGSALMFALLYGVLGLDIYTILILVVVLIVHEFGHFIAMKYFGYKNVGVMFTPIGAVTVGYKENKSAFDEFVIALMGPLPGIIISIGIFVYFSIYPLIDDRLMMVLQSYAFVSLIINYINLLPIYPLDGSRILHALLLHKYPKGQFYFYIVSVIVLLFEIILMQDYILGILIFIMVVGFYQYKAIATTLAEVLSKEHISTKEQVASFVLSKYPSYTIEKQANIATVVWSVLSMKKPGWLLFIVGMGVYILLLLPPLLAFVIGAYNYIFISFM
jgi:Zn-dependent protease